MEATEDQYSIPNSSSENDSFDCESGKS